MISKMTFEIVAVDPHSILNHTKRERVHTVYKEFQIYESGNTHTAQFMLSPLFLLPLVLSSGHM